MMLGKDPPRPDQVGDLLARCALADPHAFRELYKLEADRLFGIAWSITKSRTLAADAVHDAFTQAWNNAWQYTPARGSGQAWMTALVRYRALDARRRRKRFPHSADTLEVPDPSPNALEQLTATRDTRTLARCLAILDEPRRRLVVLAYLRGMSHADLAEHVGKPLGTVKSSIRRVLRKLRTCMEDEA